MNKSDFKNILETTKHIALATVNSDGSPHNTPLFFIYNEEFTKIYWGSHPESLHSQNIERTTQGYVSVYNSSDWGYGALYVTLKNVRRVVNNDLQEALNVHNEARKRWNKSSLPIEYYQNNEEQSMYVADIEKVEIYNVEKDQDGHIKEETRKIVNPKNLIDG